MRKNAARIHKKFNLFRMKIRQRPFVFDVDFSACFGYNHTRRADKELRHKTEIALFVGFGDFT